MHRTWLYALLTVLIAGSIALTGWLLLFDGITSLTEALPAVAGKLLDMSQAQRLWWLGAFALLSFTLQLLVVPSGSLLLIGAGFVFGVLPSVLLFTLMQCAAVWPIYLICRSGWRRLRKGRLRKEWFAHTPAADAIRSEPLVSSMVLRLTPILPSAGASTIAALSGITLRTFLLATVLVGWIRPLFFASVGAAVSEISALAGAVSGDINPLPLLLVFAAVAGLFLLRLWLRLQHRSVADSQEIPRGRRG